MEQVDRFRESLDLMHSFKKQFGFYPVMTRDATDKQMSGADLIRKSLQEGKVAEGLRGNIPGVRED